VGVSHCKMKLADVDVVPPPLPTGHREYENPFEAEFFGPFDRIQIGTKPHRKIAPDALGKWGTSGERTRPFGLKAFVPFAKPG